MSEMNNSLLPLITPRVIIRQKPLVSRALTSAQPKKKKTTIFKVKSHEHPWGSRESLSDAYELPITQREAWWRVDVKVTPVPGTYETIDFIDELNKRPNTYSFKSEGRKKSKDFNRRGFFLLPGGYEFKDFINIMSQRPATYRFKAGERYATDVLNFGLKDKYVNVPPNAYSTQNYLAIDGEQCPLKNYMFRSQSKRFQYQIVRQKEGPSPITYSVKDIATTSPAITSCFRSKIPRFKGPQIVKRMHDQN